MSDTPKPYMLTFSKVNRGDTWRTRHRHAEDTAWKHGGNVFHLHVVFQLRIRQIHKGTYCILFPWRKYNGLISL
ncbi:hypothetical protein Q3G72_008051 [Acer saccharum]|nr:hypothetical protein Q3G72_008051 [Acer saccharum]